MKMQQPVNEGMMRAENVMSDIIKHLNRDEKADDIAKRHGMTKAYINTIAGMMRKQGCDVAFGRKTAFYKTILEKWRKEKPELFTNNYGLKRKAS